MYKNYNYNCAPYNCLAEEILLGTILINPDLLHQVSILIKADCFFLESHQIIYRNFISLEKENKLDIINLLYILHEKQTLKHIGGISKIIEMMKQSQIFTSSKSTMMYTKELVNLIHKNYVKRLMIQYGYNIIQLAFVHKLPDSLIHNKASHYLDSVTQKTPGQDITNFKELIGKFLLKSTKKTILNTKYTSFLCGFSELDRLTQGLSKGDLIIIAGRPSAGKTSFAINIAYNNIQKYSTNLCIFSLEMSKEQIFNKLIAISSAIPIRKIAHNQITKNDWYKLKTTFQKLLRCNINIYDTTNVSIESITSVCQNQSKNKISIEILIIDYLQLIQVEQITSTTRAQELSYITRKLKILAQQLNIPVIVLSQLNRNIENRMNKQPLLSDLKESGCIDKNQLIITDMTYQIHVKYFLYRKSIHYLYQALVNAVNLKIYASYKHNYKIQLTSLNINITSNHQILSRKRWLREDKILEDELVYTNLPINVQQTCNYIMSYMNSLYFSEYSQTYDLVLPRYRSFISNHVTLHNSIEQDADIVMILHKNLEKHESQVRNSIVIDITLCKNRNGPTGSCKFLFIPENTYFQNFN